MSNERASPLNFPCTKGVAAASVPQAAQSLSPLEKVPLMNIRVAGVVISKDGRYATVYIGKNKRQTYMVREGDKIGDKNGVITRIGKDDRGRGEVVVKETLTDRASGKEFTRTVVLNVS